MSTKRSRSITFRLTDAEHAALERECVATGADSVSELMRQKALGQTPAANAVLADVEERLSGLQGAINEAQRVLGRKR